MIDQAELAGGVSAAALPCWQDALRRFADPALGDSEEARLGDLFDRSEGAAGAAGIDAAQAWLAPERPRRP